jgi:hypothetical protein
MLDALMPILYSGRDYLALPREPQPWLLKKLVPVSGMVNLYGKPKTRKSWAALGISEAIANPDRKDWNGLPVMKHGPVVYIQADTPREEWAGRVLRMSEHGFDIANIHFADTATLPSSSLNVLEPDQLDKLKTVIQDVKPVLVVFDTLRESFRGDENSSDIMQSVIGAIKQISWPAAVLLLSHQRKDGAMAQERMQDDLMDDQRGSGYVSGRMDNIVRLTDRRLTVKGRAVKQTFFDVIPAPEDYDEDDLEAPPPMIVFEDDGRLLLETAFKQLLIEDPKISLNAAADRLINDGATKLSADHLRKDLLPKMKRKLVRVLGKEAENGTQLPKAA